ncbi:SDR family NAD(P)-dependent oxidoreductase [Curtobacterium sp. NPDC089689]|uniref:SDR family NAD(P)-dependent oxidoreductase n=1 Tax=Curtobacterium sp. NPDC089689 TaxID=3363968 RepID=UPI0037F3DCEF
MSTIAITGAGRGLGAAIARRFGSEGLAVALIARNQERVDELANELAGEGITARGFAADVHDLDALGDALDQATDALGPIEVLAYSPLPAKEFLKSVLDTTVGELQAAVAFSVLAPARAVQHVLPGMRKAGTGTVLFINGSSAARPNAKVAGTSTGFAGESAYGQMLHDALQPEGIRVHQLIIPNAIAPGHPTHDPDVLAHTLWEQHTTGSEFRVFAEPLPAVER